MKTRFLVMLVAALTVSLAQAQAIYKWLDEKGRVQYGEKPPAGAKSNTVEQRVTSVGSQANSGKKAQETKPGTTKPAIVMYATDWCGYCAQARQYFQRNGIAYTEHDIEKSQSANADYRAKGGRGVPLILVGERRVSGFSEQHMVQVLKSAGY